MVHRNCRDVFLITKYIPFGGISITHGKIETVNAAASPPDVRRGLPRRQLAYLIGALPRFGLGPSTLGQSPYQGHSPDSFGGSYGGARARLISVGKAAAEDQRDFSGKAHCTSDYTSRRVNHWARISSRHREW
jgi:hypothetical protein